MAISEALALADHVSGPAAKMAAAMSAFEDATKRAQKAAARGADTGAAMKDAEKAAIKVASAHGKIERAQSTAAKAKEKESALQLKLAAKQKAGEAKAQSTAAKAAAKRQADNDRAAKARGTAARQSEQQDKKALGVTLGIVGAVTAVGTVALAAAVKVGQITASLVGAVAEAHATREAVLGMLNVLGSSNAPKTLENIDKLSLKLGMSLQDGRDQFLAFGKAGKTAREAASILKMRADLIAMGNSAEMADAKLKPVLDSASGGATAEALRAVGKEAGVAGAGVLAANKRMLTFEGFVTRLKQAPARIFDQLAKSAGPSLDAIGTKLNKAMDSLLESDEAKAAVGAVVSGLGKLLSVAETLAPLVVPLFKGFAEGIKPIGAALGPVVAAIGKAFGGDSASKMQTAEKIGKALGVAFTVLAGAIATVVAIGTVVVGSFVAVGVAAAAVGIGIGVLIARAAELAVGLPSLIGSAINRAKAYLDLLIDSATNTGPQFIAGLVGGINSGVGSVVEAVKNLAARAKGAITSALQIKSPSKVMQKLGGHISGGLAKGITGGQGSVEAASGGLATVSASGASGGGGGGGPMSITINVTAGPGATKQDGATMAEGLLPVIRREVTSMMRGRALELA